MAGLYSLEQAPLLRQLIQSADALGATETAWGLEQELLGVAARHPDTMQTAQILHETADRRVEMLMRYSELAVKELAVALCRGSLLLGRIGKGCEARRPALAVY